MRVRVDRMVWMPRQEAGEELIARLRRTLTIVPQVPKEFVPEEGTGPISCYAERGDWFGVPRAWWFDNAKREYEYDWSGLSFGNEVKLETTIRHVGPYAEQAEAVGAMVNHYAAFERETHPLARGRALGAILQGGTGFGKTASGIETARRLGRTTLIVVHKDFLFRQWQKRLETFLPGVKVGVVRGPVCDFEGKDFVVAMMHSIVDDLDQRRYPAEFYKAFGLVIGDEVHRVGAAGWSRTQAAFSAAYRLGLTATPRRKDGCESVFWWNIGQVQYKALRVMPKPTIRYVAHRAALIPEYLKSPQARTFALLNFVCRSKDRNRLVANEIRLAVSSPRKRKVMVFSNRLEHLKFIEAEFREMTGGAYTTSFYVGEWFTGAVTPGVTAVTKITPEIRESLVPAIARKVWSMFSDKSEAERVDAAVEAKKKSPSIALAPDLELVVKMLAEYDPTDGGKVKGLTAYFSGKSDADVKKAALALKVQGKTVHRKKKLTEAELDEAERAQVIFATYEMCKEGVDIAAVDTLVFATPESDVEQAAGRARRDCLPEPTKCATMCPWRAGECQGKPEPVISDIVDIGIPKATSKRKYRDRYYEAETFKVIGER